MDTKTALLDCAEIAVRTHGYDGFSYADLAATVGIRKASIHHHFPTKADLALALMERYSANFFSALDRIGASHSTAGELLKAFVCAYRDVLDDGTKLCLCVVFCAGRDSLSPAVLTKLDAFHWGVTAWLTEVFTMAQIDKTITAVACPETEAHACLAQMEGAQLIARAAKDVSRFDVAVAGLLNRIQ